MGVPSDPEPDSGSGGGSPDEPIDIARASARGVTWNLVQNLVGRFGSLIVVAILARILERSAFGIVALAASVMAILDLLVNQGLGDFLVQRERLDARHVATAFWTNAALGAVLAVLFAVSGPSLAAMFDEPRLVWVVYGLSISIVIRALAVVPSALLTRRFEFRALSIRSILSSVVGGTVGVVAALRGFEEMSLVMQTLTADGVALVALWLAARFRPSLAFSWSAARELSTFGLPTVAAALLAIGSRRIDTLLIGGALGLATLGSYALAQRVFQIVIQIIQKSGDAVALSALSRVGEAGPEARRDAFYSALELAGALSFPAYIGLAAVSAPLIEVIFGAPWVAESAPVLTAVALSGIALTASFLHAALLKASAQTRALLWIHVLLALVYLPLVATAVHFGIVYAAAAYTVAITALWPIEFLVVRRGTGLDARRYARSIAAPLLAALVMGGIVVALETATSPWLPAPARLPVAIALGAGAYPIALRILAPPFARRLLDVVLARVLRSRRGPRATNR